VRYFFRRHLFFPVVLIIFGLISIVSALAPISFNLGKYILNYHPPLVEPLVFSTGLSPVILNPYDFSADLTQASSWFISPPVFSTASASISFFSLSIPHLDVVDVPVQINGSDLKKSAIHYSGTSLPGEWGNTVIFGHSSLPQFYRAGNPLTVFNRLPDIHLNDDVIIIYDGVIYRYQVLATLEINPHDVQVLEQKFDRRQLTLITCVPLGTYWRRFVVIAELIN
jgi:LPXTG-site transpeptidase (sortase) family protein